MPTTDFSGRVIVKVLREHGYEFVGRTGNHVQMWDVTDDGEVRNVTIQMDSRIPEGTLRRSLSNVARTISTGGVGGSTGIGEGCHALSGI